MLQFALAPATCCTCEIFVGSSWMAVRPFYPCLVRSLRTGQLLRGALRVGQSLARAKNPLHEDTNARCWTQGMTIGSAVGGRIRIHAQKCFREIATPAGDA